MFRIERFLGCGGVQVASHQFCGGLRSAPCVNTIGLSGPQIARIFQYGAYAFVQIAGATTATEWFASKARSICVAWESAFGSCELSWTESSVARVPQIHRDRQTHPHLWRRAFSCAMHA